MWLIFVSRGKRDGGGKAAYTTRSQGVLAGRLAEHPVPDLKRKWFSVDNLAAMNSKLVAWLLLPNTFWQPFLYPE